MNQTQPTNDEQEQTPPRQATGNQFQPPTLSRISQASALEAGKIDAATSQFELDQQPNCVSSIITMSCRGRAEAFARSLQSRLRTLGSQNEHQALDTTDASESTWISNSINNNSNNPSGITDSQPRMGAAPITSEAADSYFDFDMEPESPGSPVDECEYTRLIETNVSTPQEQQAPESGFICASPSSTGESRGSASSSDVQYFDPESSDTGTEFFDCPPELRPPRRYQHLSHHRVAVKPPSPIPASQSSSESSATPTSKMNGHIRLLEEGESSDSFPPSQSTNSELSSISTASKLNSTSNSNSTLQDAEGEIAIDGEISVDANATDSQEFDEKCSMRHYEVSKTKFIKYNDNDFADEVDEAEQSTVNHGLEEEPFDQEKVLQEITTIDASEQVKEEVEQESTAKKDSDVDEEYERPTRVRRCSSLKTGKTPPGTPGRKKIVRFADVLGLDLADIRTFLDEVPKIPKSAYEDLIVTLPSQAVQLGPPLEKVLVPLFQQPGCLPGFMERLRQNQVCLESAAVTDPVSLTITGCVRVRNLDFHKSVHIRYSLDSWRSYSDLTASYVENSCDGFSDKFSFMLFGNSLQIGQRVEMAVRFQAKGEQFWDSNYGTNYCFQCLPCNARPSNSVVDVPECSSMNNDVFPDKNDGNADENTKIHTDAMGSQQWSNTFLY